MRLARTWTHSDGRFEWGCPILSFMLRTRVLVTFSSAVALSSLTPNTRSHNGGRRTSDLHVPPALAEPAALSEST